MKSLLIAFILLILCCFGLLAATNWEMLSDTQKSDFVFIIPNLIIFFTLYAFLSVLPFYTKEAMKS